MGGPSEGQKVIKPSLSSIRRAFFLHNEPHGNVIPLHLYHAGPQVSLMQLTERKEAR